MSRSASSENWKNVLFSPDRNKKMIHEKVMQDYGHPDEASIMGAFDRNDHPLESGMTFPICRRKQRVLLCYRLRKTVTTLFEKSLNG